MKDILLFWVDFPRWLLPVLICAGFLLFWAGWWKARLRYAVTASWAEESARLGWVCSISQLQDFLWDAVHANINPEGRLLHVQNYQLTPHGPMIEVWGQQNEVILRVRVDTRTGHVFEWSPLSPEDGLTSPVLNRELQSRWWKYLSMYPTTSVPMTGYALADRKKAQPPPGVSPVIAE